MFAELLCDHRWRVAGRCSCVLELEVWRDSYTRKGEGDGVARNLNTVERIKYGRI